MKTGKRKMIGAERFFLPTSTDWSSRFPEATAKHSPNGRHCLLPVNRSPLSRSWWRQCCACNDRGNPTRCRTSGQVATNRPSPG
jgi:hypothetical protein